MHYIEEVKRIVFEEKKLNAYLWELIKSIQVEANRALDHRLSGRKFISSKIIYEVLGININYYPQQFDENKNTDVGLNIISTQPTNIHSLETLTKIRKDFKSHGEFRKADKNSIIPLWGAINYEVNIEKCFDENYFFDLKLV